MPRSFVWNARASAFRHAHRPPLDLVEPFGEDARELGDGRTVTTLARMLGDEGDTNLGTCMDYTNDPSGKAGTNGTLANTSPNQHDYDELVTIYSHLDSTTTVGTSSGQTVGAAVLPPQATAREKTRIPRSGGAWFASAPTVSSPCMSSTSVVITGSRDS